MQGDLHLTSRGTKLLLLLRNGPTNKEIAAKMGVTEGTVKVMMSRIFDKLGMQGRLRVTLWARKHAGMLAELNAADGRGRRRR